MPHYAKSKIRPVSGISLHFAVYGLVLFYFVLVLLFLAKPLKKDPRFVCDKMDNNKYRKIDGLDYLTQWKVRRCIRRSVLLNLGGGFDRRMHGKASSATSSLSFRTRSVLTRRLRRYSTLC